MKNKHYWALILLVLSTLACNLPVLSGGINEASMPEPDAESFTLDIKDDSIMEPVSLSASQRQILIAYGIPNRFMLTFSDNLREETWYFDGMGYSITFRNGEIYTEEKSTPVDEAEVVKSIYYPWQFNGQMGLSELLSVSGSETFAIESLEEVFQEDATLVFLTGMDAGFREDQILFIRTVPIGAGARDLPNTAETAETVIHSDAGIVLTAGEQAHAGTHSYQITCTYSDSPSESGVEEATWEFTEEGVYYDGDGPYPKVSENYYGLQDEFGGFFILFSEEMIAFNGSLITEDEEENAKTTTFSCTLVQE